VCQEQGEKEVDHAAGRDGEEVDHGTALYGLCIENWIFNWFAKRKLIRGRNGAEAP